MNYPLREDNPSRPYKAYAALLVAFLTSYLSQTETGLAPWAIAILTAVLAAAVVFTIRNPKV